MIERIIKLLKTIADGWSSAGKAVRVKYCFAFIVLWMLSNSAAGQNCTVINSIPSTPPTSGNLDTLISAMSQYYCTQPARIYDAYAIDGSGNYVEIPVSNPLWINGSGGVGGSGGPLNACGLWAKGNPKTIGFSICVNIPADKSYYMGFASDNSGTVTIDGTPILKNLSFNFWGIYKVTLTKGIHFVGFSVVNFDIMTPASIGFEIYDNTAQQIIDGKNIKVIYSTKNELDHPVQVGDPETSYSCPVGYIPDYCSSTTNAPVCSQFVPINLVVHNPPPACLAMGDITLPDITAGSSTSLTYTYWRDSLATVPLNHPDKIPASGTYYIMGSFNGCYKIKPVVLVVNSASTIIDATICPGDTYLGHNKTGTYTDTLKAANGCDSITTVNLTVLQGVALGPDRTMCAGDTIMLNPGVYNHYLWQDNSTGSNYTVKTPGTYWVKVTDQNGCVTSDTVAVKFNGCFDATIPSAFTPNGDGVNDTWNISGLQYFPQCSVFVYNRWGQLVFKSTGYSKSWDGTISGKNLPVATYYYVIDLKNKTPVMSGFVTIIR